MKYYLLLAVWVCLSLPSVAQEQASPYAVEIDSIEKLLVDHPNDDSTEVIQLNVLSRVCFYGLQFTRGLIAAEKARQLAQRINYLPGEGLYLRTMGIFHRHTDLNAYYNIQADWKYDNLRIEEIFPNLGLEYREIDSDQYVSPLSDAYQYFYKKNNWEIAANIAFALSYYNYNSGRINAAASTIKTSLALFKKIKKKTLAAVAIAFKLLVLNESAVLLTASKADSMIRKAAAEIDDPKYLALLYHTVSLLYSRQGKDTQSIEYDLRANNELEIMGERQLRIFVLENLGLLSSFASMPKRAVDYYQKALQLRDEINYHEGEIRITFNVGFESVGLQDYSTARQYFEKAKRLSEQDGNIYVKQGALYRYTIGIGQILLGQEKYAEALPKLKEAQQYYEMFFGEKNNMYVDYNLARCYQKLGRTAEGIYHAEQSYALAFKSSEDQRLLISICLLLSELYDESGQPLRAFEYLKRYRTIEQEKEEQDLANRAGNLEIEGIILKNEQEKAILEREKMLRESESRNQRWWLFSVVVALLTAIVVTALLFRNNRQKQKANTSLNRQKEEIELQRKKAENALTELKTTQSQLIQAEKMASLGELTAGIAHEIQNPLNFVNNYSEVNVELLEELILEGGKEIGEKDERLMDEITRDLEENERKILHHGRQAEAIVRGMQQHSRRSSGTRELTDLNALTREYVDLAYNGMNAKDKLSKDVLNLSLDPTLPNLEVIPGDLGRVILNLLNNAFYAVTEKLEISPNGYIPTVKVTTRQADRAVEIRIEDNGIGVPEANLPKLFQPFFTTRPTGQGTGLGLSLAYDIVTKGHGGRLAAESKEGEGSVFTVTLSG